MIEHNINPIIISFLGLDIRWYGLFYALGFILAYAYMHHVAKKNLIKGFTQHILDNFMITLIIGVVAGARLFQYIFYRPQEILTNPLDIFMIWQGGMSFHGGLIGASIAMAWFCKKNNIRLLALADQLIIPTAFALALGRIANFINAEMYGTPSTLPWCVMFPGIENCRHPVQIYESIKTFIIFGILYFVKNKPRQEGTLFYLFLIFYGFARFIINFLRDSQSELILEPLGISMGQVLSLLMGVYGLTMIIRNNYILQKT